METVEAQPMAATTTAETQAAVEAAAETSHPTSPAAAAATLAQMFRYSAYIHVGPGAEECEHAIDGECEDTSHFHAWCRLPNKFQHRDLYAKASAAKARRLRLLDDPDSDASAILDAELDPLNSDGHVETIIDDLLKGEWAADYLAAVREVGDREEFEHIQQDRERFMQLGDTEAGKSPEEESEEFKELGRHINSWTKAVADEMTQLQEPKRESMRALGREQLVAQLRKLRVEQIGNDLYMHVYNQWEWFICTLKTKIHPALGKPFERYWTEMGSIDTPAPGSMWAASPEVIDALARTYDELERALQSGVSGNS